MEVLEEWIRAEAQRTHMEKSKKEENEKKMESPRLDSRSSQRKWTRSLEKLLLSPASVRIQQDVLERHG